MNRFNAKIVAAVELPEFETFTVALAEEPGGERLQIQRALSFDEQDRALGMDTYCLCTERGTAYGGVRAWTLTRDSLELRLDAETAAVLGVDGGYQVTFPPEYQPMLREGLERVLN